MGMLHHCPTLLGGLRHVLDDVARPSGIGHEGNDGLALEIATLEKRHHYGRRSIPPGGRNSVFCQRFQSSQYYVFTFTEVSTYFILCVNVVLNFHRCLRFCRVKSRDSRRAARANLIATTCQPSLS